MQFILNIIKAHPTAVLVGVWWIYSSAIGALNKPSDDGSKVYAYLYAFLHLLGANLDKIIAAKSSLVASATENGKGPKVVP